MDSIRKLENTVATWFKSMPHLPEGGRKWLAYNSWWLAGIGAVLGALGALTALSAALFAGGLMSLAGDAFGTVLSGLALVVVLISFVTFVTITVLLCMAITPLREHLRRGWDYLFITLIIEAVFTVVGLILVFDVVTLLSNLISLFIGYYLLFEIQEYFGFDTVAARTLRRQGAPTPGHVTVRNK